MVPQFCNELRQPFRAPVSKGRDKAAGITTRARGYSKQRGSFKEKKSCLEDKNSIRQIRHKFLIRQTKKMSKEQPVEAASRPFCKHFKKSRSATTSVGSTGECVITAVTSLG